MLNLQIQNFNSEACLSCPVLPQDSKNDIFIYDDLKSQKSYFKNIKKIVTALLRNCCTQAKFFFTAGCAGDTESSDVETSEIASAVFTLLI